MVFSSSFRNFCFACCCGLLTLQPAEAGPYSGLVVEVESERVLYSRNADEIRHPASLTKMMTLYLVFEALSRGQINLNDSMPVSSYAVSKPPSKLGLRVGSSLQVEEGILGLVTQSANDAATVIAEYLGGSESNFAAMMTRKARQLGMGSSEFYNASGLPNPNQVTTAWDMFRLGKALLKHFPEQYRYFSTERFYFGNRSFHNHNHLLENYPGTDGIKTGFVNASGFNLVASARRNGYRLIGVVFGGATHARRDAHMRALLDDGFAQLEGREPSLRVAGLEEAEAPTSLLRRPPSLESVRETFSPGRSPRRLADLRDEGDREGQGRTRGSAGQWQINVGEFGRENAAEHRLSQVMKLASSELHSAKPAVSARSRRGRKTYQAYFKGLSKENALHACQLLKRKRLQCATQLGAG